jgi:hypothetical protein
MSEQNNVGRVTLVWLEPFAEIIPRDSDLLL